MKKLLLGALVLSMLTVPAYAGNKHNQFQNWQHNQQHNDDHTYNYNYNYTYKYKNNNNYDNGAWFAGGLIGGLLLGGIARGPEPYVPPAYVVPRGGQEVCGTVWAMEPDGFGGWERVPHTVCGWE